MVPRVPERRAIVTGAGSGIGRATALELARGGMSVVAADLRPGDAGDPSIAPLEVDVTDADSVAALAAAAGTPDVVVNCAGWDETHAFVDTDRAFWERVVAI